MDIRTLPAMALSFTCVSVIAQQSIIDHRNEAEGWYLPVTCKVTAQGGSANEVTITIYKDNVEVGKVEPTKKRSVPELQLDIDSYYTVRFEKAGYLEKSVCIDTHLPPEQVRYGAYQCNVNLEPMDKFAYSDPFYLDFPSALVRWDPDKQTFLHSDPYLTDIQVKVALLATQARPK